MPTVDSVRRDWPGDRRRGFQVFTQGGAVHLREHLARQPGGVPTAELGKITAPVLVLGGKNSPGWVQRSVAEQAAATPGARLKMLEGYDHNAPSAVITPILIDFFGAHR
jgi:pimeloyl-ACP methyl ester carboxylesterase